MTSHARQIGPKLGAAAIGKRCVDCGSVLRFVTADGVLVRVCDVCGDRAETIRHPHEIPKKVTRPPKVSNGIE